MAGQQRITGIFPQLGPLGKDCHNTTNAACNIPTENGCETRYYPDGCNTKVAPSWANAITSEIANVIKDSGVVYDCSKLDNLSLAIQQRIEHSLYGCLAKEFGEAANSCNLKNLALSYENGCFYIRTYSQNSLALGRTNEASSLAIPIGFGGGFPALDMVDKCYTNIQLGHDFANNSIDRSKLNKTHICQLNFDTNCPNTLIEFKINASSVLDPTNIGVTIFAIEIDGQFDLVPSTNAIDSPLNITNFEFGKQVSTKRNVPEKGAHVANVYIIGFDNRKVAQILVDRTLPDTAKFFHVEAAIGVS